MIAIINYGAGNLRSVQKTFKFIGEYSRIIESPEQIKETDRIVLPGVGAFGSAMNKLKKAGFINVLKKWIWQDRPLLGICLGMQILFEKSEESESFSGLKILKGRFKKFKKGKIPQIGWNQLKIEKKSGFFKGIEDNTYFYFVHSYYIDYSGVLEKNSFPRENTNFSKYKNDKDIISTTTDYFCEYISSIEFGNILAVQFHPEKSGDAGIKLLKNWVKKC